MTYRGIEFNGTTSTGTHIEIWCNFDANSVWKGERLLILADAEGNDVVFESAIGNITYKVDTNEKVIIDITDYIRTYADIGDSVDIDLRNSGSATTLTTSCVVAGLINPASVYIPCHPLQDYAPIVPPSVMYCALDQSDKEVAEVYSTATLTLSGDAALSLNKRYIGQITGAFTLTRLADSHTWTPRAMLSNHHYALVEWVSFTGQTRKHYWEIKKNTIAQGETISILTLDNSYNDIRGREDGFTLSLDGLNAYDFWYYSDLITSSSVYVTLNGTKTQVQIATKNVTIPDGDAIDGKIEIAVNWKKYDAVAL